MRLALVFIYVTLVLISLAFLMLGVVSFFTTLALYGTILIIVFAAIGFYPSGRLTAERRTNYKIAALSIILTLCVTDLALRYVIRAKKYLDHNESNGGWCYSSYPLRAKYRFITKHFYNFERENGAVYINPPNKTKTISNYEFTYTHRYNSEGLRNKELAVAKQKNEIRIIALGDSYTEGVGAPQDSTWPFFLERGLQSNDSAHIYTVMNAGVYGSDPFFESYLLKARLLKYQPDIVMVAVNHTDILDMIERGGYERFNADSSVTLKSRPWWEPIYGASIIARMFVRKVLHYGYSLTPPRQEPADYLLAEKTLAVAINQLQNMAKRYNFKLVVVFVPAQTDFLLDKYDLDATKRLVTDTAISIIDLQRICVTRFKQTGLKVSDYYWPRDGHANGKGYFVWSQLLLGEMKNGGPYHHLVLADIDNP